MPKTIDGKPVNEEKWNKAKQIAAKEGRSDDFAYITGIYKKMVGLKSHYSFVTDKFGYHEIVTKSGKKYYVTGYVSTPDIDLVNDIVTPNAMRSMLTQIKGRNILLDYDHDVFRTENNDLIAAGKITEAKIDSKGLWVKAELNPLWKRFSDDKNIVMNFSELWTNIKSRFIKGFSIAFKPIKTVTKAMQGMQVRLLEDLQLINVALTSNPVCQGALITGDDMKSVILKAINDLEHIEDSVCSECGNNYVEVNKMTEEIKSEEAPVEEATTEETVETTVEETTEETAEPEVETAPEESVEEKSKIDSIIEELKSRIDSLEKENNEIKNNSVFKSKTPEEAQVKVEDEKPLNMLSLI